MQDFLKKHKTELFLFIASFLYLGSLSFLEYSTLSLGWHDFGMQIQMLSSPLFSEGRLWSYDWNSNFLSIHFSPLLYLLSVFLIPLPFIECWLIICSLALSVGIVALFSLFRRVTDNSAISVIFSLAFLLNPYVTATHLYIHYEIFLVPLLSGFLLFAWDERKMPAFVCLLGILLLKEDGWIYVCAGSFLLLGRKPIRTILVYSFTSLLYLVIVLGFFKQILFPNSSSLFLEHWGKTPFAFILNSLTHPSEIFRILLTDPGKFLAMSLLGIPLLATWRSLPGFAVAFLWLSSISPDRAGLAFFYGLAPTLILFMAIPFAFLVWEVIASRILDPRKFIFLLPISLLITSITISALPNHALLRSPNLLLLSASLNTIPEKIPIIISLIKLRGYKANTTFASFNFATYVFNGAELRLPYKDWEAVRARKWRPDLVILTTEEKEPLLTEVTSTEMILFFDKDPEYTSILRTQNLRAWRKAKI
ncbi:membrane protein, PF09852 family [Leptospira fainei serovar Hurstbridge str. BUT 6]|uniref:Membrane protein, PF09852 family n=1 Tax=Leptospira fainei serovar Hurstbridge str. BUT 6 TaxID=1193011 RepID=S3VB63_9LEPT|nr:DUF2079 domain-containing protein [Leptospira fainei]EPG73705.1 membrane protein, PF09852 family [Leptospira fainei serovar Hurstbridge str. BUT 6]